MNTERSPSQLFIPYGNKDLDALRWRLLLVDTKGIYSKEKLVRAIKSSQEKNLDASTKRELVKLALSDSIEIDEYEMTLLIVTQWLLEAETMAEKKLLQIDRKTKRLLNFIKDPEDYLQMNRSNLKRYGEILLKNDISKIRAKVAFKELVALLAPNEIIPSLVSFSPRYLGSEFVQKWITIHQQNAYFGSTSALKKDASENLRNISKAIEGDKRKNKKRQYSYWQSGIVYERLSSQISGFREHSAKGTLDESYYRIFLEHHKIPSEYAELILQKRPAAKQLALEIMISLGLIDDEKAFKDFQPTINKIQKKHFDGNVLSISDEFMPIVFDFLDLPTTHPEMIRSLDPLNILEKVPLNIIRPKS